MITKNFNTNIFYNIAGSFFSIGIIFLLTPFTINQVGLERYGIWVISNALFLFLNCLDLGLKGAFVRYLSPSVHQGNHKKINQVINTSVGFYCVWGVLGVVALLPLFDVLFIFFNINPVFYEEMHFVFNIGVVLFFLSNIFQVFHSLLTAAQRFDLTNKIIVGTSVLNAFGTVFFLRLGFGLEGLAVNACILFVVTQGLIIATVLKLFPSIRLSPSLLNKNVLTEMLVYGLKTQVSQIADIITLQTDRLIVAFFFNANFVAFHQVGSSLVSKLREIPGIFFSVMLPAACSLAPAEKKSELIAFYLDLSKKTVTFSIPLFLFVAASAQLIVFAWMGAGFELSGKIISLLAIGYLFNILSGVGCVLGQAISRPDLQMKAATLTAVLNIVLTLLLVKNVGFLGVALATSLSFGCSTFVFFLMLHKEIGMRHSTFFKDILLPPLMIATVFAGLLFQYNSHIIGGGKSVSRTLAFTILSFEGISFVTLYLFFLVQINFISSRDLEKIKSAFFNFLPFRARADRIKR